MAHLRMAARRLGEQIYGPALGTLRGRKTRQGRNLCLLRCAIPLGLAWALDITQRVFKPALQVCGAGSPDRGTPHARHFHDLGLRNLPIQRQEDMGTVELARHVLAFDARAAR
ncbi:MAG: hypothetical protein A3G81_20980 [Betaproteobacteria bacterium RIFCSPLOWO2_12_FULL_65_14]|nr:MAG: hypothetical protein A3G81_20980 [Betaproteobacteria bacterium RIFCSPLOWO2_12_FULL_65_14]